MSLIDHAHGVILAGGSGTRLWPISTQHNPKQFLKISSEESLIQRSLRRLSCLLPYQQCWVLGSKLHEKKLRAHLSQISRENFLLEPVSKNTAPPLVWAAFHLYKQDPDAIMLVLPADQWIQPQDEELFVQDLTTSLHLAQSKQAIVTFGIQPHQAATGFGYIEKGLTHTYQGQKYFEIQAFHEKPNLELATQYLQSGNYFWNSGMFVWPVRVFLDEIKIYAPQLYEAFESLDPNDVKDQKDQSLQKVFESLSGISIDYALMEHTQNVLMIPASFQWDDVGSWTALAHLLHQDQHGNASIHHEKIISLASRNNLVISEKPVALLGMEDCVIVEVDKTLLVAKKDQVQKVKELVEILKKENQFDLL